MKPRIFPDARGYFYECHRLSDTRTLPLVQSNLCRSRRGVLRGLHLQKVQPQAKLVSVVRGAIFDVAVDVRPQSPTFGQWRGFRLDDENHHQLYIPIGFAHGYCVLSEEADILYQCSDYYHPGSEVSILWNDSDIGIEWPVSDPILSQKEALGIPLQEYA
ncbi:dTDP-4-dehydrorhamnose 3,5-epimerase [bacterium SCN 62-11]|nr:MAG: dTDP-4-dehydrorhamnose 3,5-epimerase [bacterium SCN 62-11]